MRKIPTLFVRDEADRKYVTEQVNPGCEWVFTDPDVRAERKYDGTCVMLDEHGAWWARREVKPGKPTPPNFVPLGEDGFTHKVMGYEPISQSTWATWHAEALATDPAHVWVPGTYELVGPRINGNPERYEHHWLIQHAGAELVMLPPYTHDSIREMVAKVGTECGYEGVVFKHPDGRMCKLKARDLRKEVAAG